MMWMMGSNVPWWSLPMMANRRGKQTLGREGHSAGTDMDRLRERANKNLRSSNGQAQDLVPGKNRIQVYSTSWNLTGLSTAFSGEELCGKGPRVQQGQCEWTLCCCSSKARLQEAGLQHQQRHTGHHPALLSTCQVISGVLCSVWIPAVQKRCGQAGEGPKNSHKDGQRTGKLPYEERLEKMGLRKPAWENQPWEEKA